MMKAEFDHIANNYDFDFTDSPIGRLQRNQVYHFLDPILKTLSGRNILDLGCGTGEDAIWLAEKGFNVTAIDYSSEMLQMANQKTATKNLRSKITYYSLSITQLSDLPKEQKFDLIFSNFGALNCIDPIYFNNLAQTFADRLHPKGHMVLVVLNRFCLWESCYFILQGKFNLVFRRKTDSGILVSLTEDVKIRTWYHSPTSLYSFFKSNFTLCSCSPIGLLVPPSYVSWFRNAKNIKCLAVLDKIDRLNPLKKLSSFASDHFILYTIKK